MLSIIIPYRKSDSKVRERNFEFVVKRFEEQFKHMNHEIIIGEQTQNEKWYCRSNCINNGVRQSSGDVLLISDADILIDFDSIIESLQYPPFVIPFGRCINMNKKVSEKILNGEHVSIEEMEKKPDIVRDIRPGTSMWGDKLAGGIQLIDRELFDKVGGMDERFIGWGWEDSHFCWKIMAELGDYKILTNRKVYHLWHPRDSILNYKNVLLGEKEKKRLGIE